MYRVLLFHCYLISDKKNSRRSVICKQLKVFVVFLPMLFFSQCFQYHTPITPTFHHGPEKFSCFRFRQFFAFDVIYFLFRLHVQCRLAQKKYPINFELRQKLWIKITPRNIVLQSDKWSLIAMNNNRVKMNKLQAVIPFTYIPWHQSAIFTTSNPGYPYLLSLRRLLCACAVQKVLKKNRYLPPS